MLYDKIYVWLATYVQTFDRCKFCKSVFNFFEILFYSQVFLVNVNILIFSRTKKYHHLQDLEDFNTFLGNFYVATYMIYSHLHSYYNHHTGSYDLWRILIYKIQQSCFFTSP